MKRSEGFPVFSTSNLPFPISEAYPLLSRIVEELIKKDRNDRDSLERLKKLIEDDPSFIEQLYHSVLNNKESENRYLSEKIGLESSVIEFIIKMSIKPLLYQLRDRLASEIKEQQWEYGYCPICGSEPMMGYLDEDGKRYLHCSLCDYEWRFPRITCPFCNNQDSASMGYIFSEEDDGIRIDFCRKCNRYIKTIDKRIYSDPCKIELEYIATIYLDILAQKEGFK